MRLTAGSGLPGTGVRGVARTGLTKGQRTPCGGVTTQGAQLPGTGPGAEARRESPCSRPQASGGAHNGLSQVCAPSAAAAQRGARLTGRTTLTRAARSARLAGVDGGRDDHASPTTHGEQAARPSRSCRSRSAPAGGVVIVSALDPQDGGVGVFAAQPGCAGIARRSITCGLSGRACERVVPKWSPGRKGARWPTWGSDLLHGRP